MADLTPLSNRIIVRVIPPEKQSAGGIILTEQAQVHTHRGTVIAVGRDSELCEGDDVLYSPYGGTEISVDGEDLLVLRDSDVLAKFEE